MKTFKTILKFLITVFLVFLLLKKINWLETWEYFKQVKIIFVLLYVFLYFGGILISARKWQLLAKFKKFQRPYFFYLKTYLLGTFFNNFFPSFVGGDTYRIYVLGKKEKRLGDSSATIIVDRISGLLAVIFLAGIFGLFNYQSLQKEDGIFSLILVMIGISALFILGKIFFNFPFFQKIINCLPNKLKKYINTLGSFQDKNIFWTTMNYSFLFMGVGIALANYMLFLAFGVHLSWLDFLSVTFLTNLIASLPISVGNIGVKEWAYVFLFGIFGVQSSVAVAVVLLARVLQMLVSLVAVPFYLNRQK